MSRAHAQHYYRSINKRTRSGRTANRTVYVCACMCVAGVSEHGWRRADDRADNNLCYIRSIFGSVCRAGVKSQFAHQLHKSSALVSFVSEAALLHQKCHAIQMAAPWQRGMPCMHTIWMAFVLHSAEHASGTCAQIGAELCITVG